MERTFDKRLLIGIGLVVALLLVDAALDYYNTRELHADAAQVARTHAALEALADVDSTMKDAQAGQRGYLITGDPSYLEPYHDAAAAIDQKVKRLADLTADSPRQQTHLPALYALAAALQPLDGDSAPPEANAEPGKAGEPARRNSATDASQRAIAAVRSQASEMAEEERRLLADRQRQTDNRYRVAQITCLITMSLSLALVAGFVYVLRQYLLERAKAAAAVHEQREWFRTTLASIGDAVIATDTAGHVTFLNTVAQTLTGWREDEALGTSLDDVFQIVAEDTRRPAENPVTRALKQGAAVGLANHTLLISKQGVEVPIDDRASPIRGASGDVAGVVLVFRDVTERRRVEAEQQRRSAIIEQRAEGLAEADRMKNDFLAMLAHELRNPLAPIRNAVYLLQIQLGEKAGSPEQNTAQKAESVRQPLAIIERQVEALVRLVDDLLDVSRITRGKIKLHPELVDVAAIVDRAIESSRPLIDARRHELDVSLPSQPTLVKADVTRMAQVVLNLLNNAAKYTPEGGHLWLTVQHAADHVAIEVRDNGMGIAAEVLPSVFDLFAQSERTLDRSDGGLGVGLPLARRLTEMHGGQVAAFSDGPGQGSQFVVRLPLAESDAASAPTAASPTSGLLRESPKHRVLVVDDNRDSADSLAMLLRLAGHDVRTVHDGRQALAAVAAYRPDLMLLDIGLPGMDGYAVARQIRTQPELAGVVLVALTGYGSDEDRRRSQTAGFDHHLVKPAEMAALQELLDRLAAGKNAAAAEAHR